MNYEVYEKAYMTKRSLIIEIYKEMILEGITANLPDAVLNYGINYDAFYLCDNEFRTEIEFRIILN